MRSHLESSYKHPFQSKREGEGGEVSWTKSMPLITPFVWRFASSGLSPSVPAERGCHAQGWRHNPEAAGCMLQRILYKAVEATDTVASVTTVVCQALLALPSILTKFPRHWLLCLSSSKDTPQSSPSPHLGHSLLPVVSLVPVAQPSPSPSPFLPSPLTTAPAPLPLCQALCSTLVPPGPWATSSLQSQEL